MYNSVKRAGLLVQSADMGRIAANTAYVVIRDSGHAINLNQSASFNRIVLDFTASLERRG
jgi:hypothetical protein